VLSWTQVENKINNKKKYLAVSRERQDSDEESKLDSSRIEQVTVEDLDAEAGFLQHPTDFNIRSEKLKQIESLVPELRKKDSPNMRPDENDEFVNKAE